jgi:3-deoxy-7-phosphoheptulonate synthase
MVIVMQAGATEAQVEGVIGTIKGFGFQAHPIHGVNLTVIAVVGDKTQEHLEAFQLLEGVDHVARIDKPYKLAARRPEIVGTTVIEVGQPVARCCEAGRTSRAPRPTPSRACARPVWRC